MRGGGRVGGRLHPEEEEEVCEGHSRESVLLPSTDLLHYHQVIPKATKDSGVLIRPVRQDQPGGSTGSHE